MKYIITGVLALTLSGCMTPDPVETKPEDAQALINSMVFAKNKNGLCFGVVTVERMSTSGSAATNQMITTVDCQKAGL